MNLRKLSESVNDRLLDEQLLRLLCYAPKNANDDSLSPSKPDILTMSNQKQKWDLINNHLMSAASFTGMDNEAITRLIFYAGQGQAGRDNHLFTNQQYVFDIYTHYSIQNYSRRIEAIVDRISELLFRENIAGIGETLFVAQQPIMPASLPDTYVGFRVVYKFCLKNN